MKISKENPHLLDQTKWMLENERRNKEKMSTKIKNKAKITGAGNARENGTKQK